jgi:hypothetical protein
MQEGVMATVWLRREDCETGRLPDLCLRCGRPATRRVAKDFRTSLVWSDPLSLLVGGVEGWTARVPMCGQHRLYWCRSLVELMGAMTLFLGLPVSAASLVIGMGESNPFIALFGCLATASMCFVVFLALLGLMSIHATEMHENGVRLINVHKDFVKAYESQTQAGRDQAADE